MDMFLDPNEVQIIKRYANRKLYHVQKHQYVTLSEVGDLVSKEYKVLVIDNTTKNNITSQTMLQVLFDRERSAIASSNDEVMYTNLIKNYTSISSMMEESNG